MREAKRAQGQYGIGTLVRLTGLSPALLRAWEKRHGLLEPRRTEGGHRYYTDDDLSVLREVGRMLDGGARIGEVAALGRATLLERARGPMPAMPAPLGERSPNELVERLVEAASEIDEPVLVALLDKAFALWSPVYVLRHVMEPASREIGALWAQGRISVASEHLLSGHLVRRVQRLVESTPALSSSAPRVICACFPDETHELAALCVAFSVARQGCRALYLGASLPFADLVTAVQAVRPALVCLSVTRRATFEAHRAALEATVRSLGGRVPFVVGGSGATPPDPALEALGVRFWEPGRDPGDLALLV